ncbi:ATP-binding cassette domain-containing protein [Paenibacillus shunpengii]|uniref:ATP-binding cassette domain-containing protein n=1 Tax=Paenibacillus shunpengii TaxID=2054424 RepID=A0ABW5SR07_9BACL
MSHLLNLQRLTKYIGTTTQTMLFSGVEAQVEQGERIAVIGASGQGKSTLLRILSLLDSPDEGEMEWKGVSYRRCDPRVWRMKITYVAQHPVMLPGSVEDNLRMVHSLHKVPYDQALAQRLLERSGLSALDIQKRASDLSGGEKQRIALIRSMMLRPEALLLDEVTASLDPANADLVEQLLTEWSDQEGTTLIWVTHDLKQARSFSTTTWYMGSQTLLERQPTALFFSRPDTEAARRFITQSIESDKEEPCPSLH